MNNNELLATIGTWVQAIGTTLSAISTSPSLEKLSTKINFWGNVGQASGNFLVAKSEKTWTLDKVGNDVQALGNSIIAAGIFFDVNKNTMRKLSIIGNGLQSLGDGLSLTYDLGQQPSTEDLYSIYGNFLQMVGNALQALSGSKKLQNKLGKKLNQIGSWVQAAGAIILGVGQNISYENQKKKQRNEPLLLDTWKPAGSIHNHLP